MRVRSFLASILLLAIGIGLSACGQYPPVNLDTRLAAVEKTASRMDKQVKAARVAFTKKLTQPQYSFAAGYSPEQKGLGYFNRAEQHLRAAKQQHGLAKRIGDNYSKQKRGAYTKALIAAEASLRHADASIKQADPWLADVLKTSTNPKARLSEAQRDQQTITQAVNTATSEVTKARRQFSVTTYQKQIAELNTDLVGLNQRQRSLNVDANIEQIRMEIAKAQPNYAEITRWTQAVGAARQVLWPMAQNLTAKADDMDARWSKTVIATHILPVVYPSRSVWYYNSSSEASHDTDYPPVVVDHNTALKLAKVDGGLIATIDHEKKEVKQNGKKVKVWVTKRSLQNGVTPAQFSALKLNLDQGGWPKDFDSNSQSDTGEITAEVDLEECVKVKAVRDGKPDTKLPAQSSCSSLNTPAETAQGVYWMPGSVDNILMDVESKRYGQLKATTVAAPPCAAYINDPSAGVWYDAKNKPVPADRWDELAEDSVWKFSGDYSECNSYLGSLGYYGYGEYQEIHRHYGAFIFYSYYGSTRNPRFGAKSSSLPPAYAHYGAIRNRADVRRLAGAVNGGGSGGKGK